MNDQLRIGDAEREAAAAELGEHYAQGRLTQTEHGERLDRVWAARTQAELTPVFGDLPSSLGRRTPPAGPWTAPGRTLASSRGLHLPGFVMVLLAALLVVTVLTHLPLILIGLGIWFLVVHKGRRHRQHWQSRGRARTPYR
ncbi:MAG: DUF1707 SHOCT-like domain-containing protein [Nocardioides sp.]